VSAERRWWGNLVRVLSAPRQVFGELRCADDEDMDARQEPVLLIVLLAGMAGVLATPTGARLMDDSEYDGLLVAVWTFIAGGFYGFAVYMLGGAALWLGVRGMGGFDARWRTSRHVLAFACAPLALSLLVVLPLRLIAFGGDALRSGGADAGAAGTLVWALQGAFVVWSLGLLVVGLREVYGFTWGRALGTFGLVALFLTAMVAVPSVL
jgi:hypothetical protein